MTAETVADYRALLLAQHAVTPLDQMLEVVGASFIADEPAFFGEPNWDWIEREQAWYDSRSLNVYDIPGGPPKIWRDVAAEDGTVVSNYGWAIYSPANGSQYANVLAELNANPESRRGSMIVTRPTMHRDAVANGRSDFCCSHSVDWLIRGGALQAVVHMRSQDLVFGYPTDRAWWAEVQSRLARDLGVVPGRITWNASSLHLYPRHRSRLA